MDDSKVNNNLNQEDNVSLEINLQYIKDLSFENPNPLTFLSKKNPQFETQIGVDVQPKQLGDDYYEVILVIRIKVQNDDKDVYLLDLQYSSIFNISNASEELLRLLLLVECPRQIFPFARAVVSRVTQESGFPPLDLKPINFLELLKQKLKSQETGSTEGADDEGTVNEENLEKT